MIPSFQFRGKGSGTARFHLQGRALQVSGENHPRPAPVFSPKTLPVEAVRILAPEIGNDMFHRKHSINSPFHSKNVILLL